MLTIEEEFNELAADGNAFSKLSASIAKIKHFTSYLPLTEEECAPIGHYGFGGEYNNGIGVIYQHALTKPNQAIEIQSENGLESKTLAQAFLETYYRPSKAAQDHPDNLCAGPKDEISGDAITRHINDTIKWLEDYEVMTDEEMSQLSEMDKLMGKQSKLSENQRNEMLTELRECAEHFSPIRVFAQKNANALRLLT